MTDILKKIEDYKREEIAAAKRARSYADVEARRRRPPPRAGFCKRIERRIAAGEYALIAEIKKASPRPASFAPTSIRRAGPRLRGRRRGCLSVLTDGPSFQGKPEFLTAARGRMLAAGAAQGFHVRALSGRRIPRARRRLHPHHHGVAR
jgi:indole-3-glycerol phosphate synthase